MPGLTAEAAGPTSIMLTWTAPASDNGSPITGYQLQRKLSSAGAFDDVDDDNVETDFPLEAATRQYTDTGLNSGIVYQYRIRAITADPNVSRKRSNQQGVYSAVVSATTAAGIPEEPTLTGMVAWRKRADDSANHLTHPHVDGAGTRPRQDNYRLQDRPVGLLRRQQQLGVGVPCRRR